MRQKYSSAELMAAILDLRDGLGERIDSIDARLNGLGSELRSDIKRLDRGFEMLRYDMNRRFDSVDLRFDVFEKRLNILEQR